MYYKQALESGVPVKNYVSDDGSVLKADFVVDTMFGIGFHGEPRAPFDSVFEALGKSSATVISVDTPSGTDSTSGAVCKNCVRADFTIAVSTLKFAHVLPPSNSFCGETVTVNIGIPEDCYEEEYAETVEKEDIKQVLDKYQNHLQLIYNIYSKIDFTKISFNFKEGIREESFKQFLINFTVLGLLVSSDQMTWIFKEITRPKLKERENQAYLDFHDFQMALAYLGIFARFADRNRKIKPADIDNTNGNTVEYFLKFMGLELPFDKLDLEQYINDRRAMTVKDLLNLQQELRKNDVMEFKKKEMEIEEKKKKEMRKKRMEMEKKKREEEKKSDNGNLNNNQQNEEKKSDNKSNKDIKSSKSIKSVKDNKNTKEDNKSANEKKEAKKKK